MFTALFLISEGTADIEIRELPAGGIVSAEGGVLEQKQKYLLSAAYLAKKLNYKLLFHLHRKRFHHVKTVLDTLYH